MVKDAQYDKKATTLLPFSNGAHFSRRSTCKRGLSKWHDAFFRKLGFFPCRLMRTFAFTTKEGEG